MKLRVLLLLALVCASCSGFAAKAPKKIVKKPVKKAVKKVVKKAPVRKAPAVGGSFAGGVGGKCGRGHHRRLG